MEIQDRELIINRENQDNLKHIAKKNEDVRLFYQ